MLRRETSELQNDWFLRSKNFGVRRRRADSLEIGYAGSRRSIADPKLFTERISKDFFAETERFWSYFQKFIIAEIF